MGVGALPGEFDELCSAFDEFGSAFVVGSADLDELRTLAEAELAPFKRPRDLRRVDALPRNPAGKVLKTELRIRFSASAEADAGGENASDAADPG